MLKFRTELQCRPSDFKIAADEKLLFIGSCFSDEIGRSLSERGFDTLVNPLGPLYNPLSIRTCIERSLTNQLYIAEELTPGPRGFHCLDYSTRFSGKDSGAVLEAVNTRLEAVRNCVASGAVVFVTLGTSFVYQLKGEGRVVGNCHKFPGTLFDRRRIDVGEATAALRDIVALLAAYGARRIVFTVSPIRHLSDGFHENTLSKATLHIAVDSVCCESGGKVSYFPSYEIVMDDLRDYRAYADDLVHVSSMAVAYIYEKFEEFYFTDETRRQAAEARKKYLASLHRPILEK